MGSSLSFEINLAGNFASALDKANTGLEGTAQGTKHAKHEMELFEGEIGKLGGSIGGLGINFAAMQKGGSLFTFDLAEGLRDAYEILTKVIDGFVDLGKEMIGTAAKTQDLNLAIDLNVGPEKAKQIGELAESFAETTRFSAGEIKKSMMPLLKIGISDTTLLDDITTIGTDMAARTGGGLAEVQHTIDGFAGLFQKGRIKPGGLEAFGIQAHDYFDELGKSLGVSNDAAAKMAKAGKVSQDKMARIAINMVAARQGGGIGDPTLRSKETLGGTLDRLSKVKDTLFEGIADSPGMASVQGFLNNFIETMEGPIGKDLVQKLSTAFTTLFGDLSGPDGLSLVEDGIKRVANWIESVIDGFERAWPSIKSGFEDALPVIESLAKTLGLVVSALAALPKYGNSIGDELGQADADAQTGTVGRMDIGGGGHISLDDRDRDDVLKRAGKNGFFHKLFSSDDTLNSEAFSQIDDEKGAWEKFPQLAAGGIVSSPTLAMIGESGPEAVIPLTGMSGNSSLGSRDVSANFNFYISTTGEEGDVKRQTAEVEQTWRIELKKMLDEADASLGVTTIT